MPETPRDCVPGKQPTNKTVPRSFHADVQLYGPQPRQPASLSLRESRRHCRRLARRHYENFTVASWLLPRSLRQHIYNVYAYCRWADDLADEVGDPARSLSLLDWWEAQLRACYRSQARHPVFIALRETIEQFQIPAEPFADLLVAFRQDQQKARYDTLEELLDYCRYSANPVGRLVLYLGRCHTPEQGKGDSHLLCEAPGGPFRQKVAVTFSLPALADAICTGLQLANFCQDVARDWKNGRIYLPQADCRRFGYSEAMFAGRECNEAFRRLLAAQVAQAETWLRRGLPLVDLLPPQLRLDVALFVHGGLAILQAIRRQDYDVWTSRPKTSRMEKLRIFTACWRRLKRENPPGRQLPG